MAKKPDTNPIGSPPFEPVDLIKDFAQFQELHHLTPEQLRELAYDCTHAAAFASIGYPADREDVSGFDHLKQFFFADIREAMLKQGLPVKTSRGYHAKGQLCEALIFRLARQVAKRVRVKHPRGYTVALTIPKDPYRLLKASGRVVYNR